MTNTFNRILEKYEKRFAAIEQRLDSPSSRTARSVRFAPDDNSFVRPERGLAEVPFVALNERIAAQQEEITILRNRLREINLALSEKESCARRAQAEQDRLEREREALACALSEREAALKAAEENNSSLLNDIRFLKAEIAFHVGQAEEAFARKADCEAALQSKEEEISRLFSRLSDIEKERDELDARLKIAQLRCRPLRSEYSLGRKKSRSPFTRIVRWLAKPVAVIGTGRASS